MPKYYNKVPFIKKTDADWTSLNPILMDGEIILVTGEDEIVRLKVGDGVSNYSDLDYISDGASTYGTRMKIGDGVSTYSNLRFVTFAKGSVTQEQYAELLTLIEDTNLRIDDNDESIDKIEQNLSAIESLANILRTDLDNVTSEVSEHRTKIDTALTGIGEVSNRLTNLESSFEETSNVFREKLSSHDTNISDIFSRVEALESIDDEIITINTNIESLSDKVNKNITSLNNLDNRVSILETNGGGSSVDNEELLDIRKGYNNIIYDKAGDAVRALGNELSSLKISPNDLGLTIEGGIVYPTYKNKASIHGVKIEGSGGGGVVNPEYLFVIKNEMEAGDTFSVSYGETTIVDYTFTSLDPFTYQPTGNGTASYHVNSNQVAVQSVKQGFNSFDCTKYLAEGNNTVTVTIKNSYGESKSFTWNIKCISVRLSSSFNYDFINTKNYFSFRYTVYGEGIKKDVHFILDGVKDNEVKTVESSGETFSKTFENLTHGVHTLEVYAIGYVNGEEIRSNTLKYDVIIALSGETTPIVSINCEQSSIQEGELIKIPYVAYDPQNTQSTVTLEIHQLVNGVYELYHKETRSVTSALQYWNTRQYPIGDVKFTVSLGDVSRSIIISIEKADFQISAIETDLELYLSSNGRSNSQENRDVWEYKGKEGTITTDFNNVNWSSSSGWVIDDNGDTCLRLQSGSTAVVNFKPFTNVTTFGKTIEFEFAIKNINNRNASVISCVQNGKGVNITADSAILTSDKLKSYCHISDEKKIRVSFTIEGLRENRMMSIYLDGVLTSCMQYSGDDNFDHAEYITIGSAEGYCTVDLYTVRVYSFALSQRNIITNYISDIADLTEKKKVYLRNNIYDSSMKLDYAKVKNQIPVMTITGTLPPKKGEPQTVHITYEDPFDSSMNFTDWESKIDVQGTSSQYYVRKNYKIKLPQKYAHIKGGVETKTYCMKADYAEATSTHNTQNANIIHTLYDTKTPAQEIHPNCRTTIQGFPCVIYHKATMESKPTFLGKYNFNYDKGSEEVFFGLPEDNLKVESWEFCNNDTNACNFLGNIPEKYDEVVVENGVSVQKGWCKTFERRYPDNDLIADGDEDPTEAIANFRKMHDWVVSTKTMNLENSFQLAEYKKKFEEIFDLDKMLTYYVWTFFFLMVDQRAKNMFMTYWDKTKKWEPWFYDNDTCLGINNEGALVYDYYHEDTDKIKVVSTTGETVETNVYNGQNSTLWNQFRVAYADKIQQKYRDLRSSGKLTYNKIKNQFVTEGSDKWSETIYNEDSDFKYISMLRENKNATYLPQIKGTGEHHLDYFLDARLNYCDSKWNSAGYTNDPGDKGYAQDYILLRINTPTTYGDVEPNQNITVYPFSDMYAGIKYNSNGTLMQKRVKKGEKCEFSAPANSVFNDFDTLIFGASQLSKISDLAPLYCHFADVASATKLIELKLGSEYPSYTSKLDALNLGANKLLKRLDVRHCNSLINPLNLVECTSIETVLAEGSSISGMDLGESGYLKTVHLPSTVVTLTLKNQHYIEDFSMEAYVNITTLNIENTNNIPIKDIILAEPTNCRYLDFNDSTNKVKTGLRSSALERVRLMNVNFNVTDEEELRKIYNKLKTCKGIDENGLNIDKAVVNGIVNIPSITDEFLKELNASFPELMVCENGKNLCAVSYYNHGSTEPIYIAIVEQGSNAPDIVATGELGYIPTRPETADYKYEYRGWSDSLENIQKNKSVSAVYDTYYAVKFMNGETELHKEYVLGGNSATDPLQNNTISTPTKESSAQYDFKFIGWDKEFSNVVDVTYVNAVFSETIRSYMITFYNESNVLESKLVDYGTIPEYTGETPLKQGVSYPQDYKFKGWTPELEAVTGEASYYAEFHESDHILDSWYEVANSVQDGTYKKYELGSLHRFVLTTGEMVEVELVGYDHDVTEDGKVCGLTFITKNILNDEAIMTNKNEPNTASWINSLMKKHLENNVLPYLPTQINDIIVPVVKTTTAGNGRQYTIDTVDKIWLPSVYELSETTTANSSDGKTYEFFKNKTGELENVVFNKRIKLNANGSPSTYWTRSPASSYTYRYWSIKPTGETHILADGWEVKGVVFGFCIGKK